MNEDKSVAVLLSTYNGEEFLKEQIASVFYQTYKNVYIYLRDDCSKDTTPEIIEKIRNRDNVHVFPSTSNLGPSLSFCKMLEECGDHEYYAFCDQDDVWDKDKLEIAIEHLEKFTGPALYFCNSRLIDKKGKVIGHNKVVENVFFRPEAELVCGICPGCSMVFNKELLKAIRCQKYRSIPMHDLLVIMICFSVGKVISDDKEHFSRRMHDKNVVGKKGKNVFLKIKQKYNRWIIDSRKNPLDVFVRDYMRNNAEYTKNNRFLNALASYKSSISDKWYITKASRKLSSNKSSIKSFAVRTWLNLL